MQADTLVPSHQGTQGFDRYAYINNNPVNGTDPSGHWLRNTNVMMSDGGAATEEGYLNNIRNNYNWDVRGKWTINELAKLNNFGINLDKRVSSINGGRGQEWIRHNTAGMVIEKETLLQKAIILFLSFLSINQIAGTVPSPIVAGQVYIDNANYNDVTICHEMIHVIDNVLGNGWLAATYAGGGPADELVIAMGGNPRGIRWRNIVDVNDTYLFGQDNRYGNTATAEYFAVGFTEFILNPEPKLNVDMSLWFAEFIKRTTP